MTEVCTLNQSNAGSHSSTDGLCRATSRRILYVCIKSSSGTTGVDVVDVEPMI
jgi:hypothetical protein